METEITHIAVMQTAKVMAVVHGLMGLVMLPFMLLSRSGSAAGGEGGMASVLVMTLLYPVAGFFVGMLFAAFYNLAAGWLGGLRFTMYRPD